MKGLSRAKSIPATAHQQIHLDEGRRFKNQERTQAGTAICQRCGAVGMHKKWFVDERIKNQAVADPMVRYCLCPGCKRVQNQVYEGEVTLRSPVIQTNREMVYGTIYHTAAKAYADNPTSQIAIFEQQGEKIRILTTTRWLAMRIGKSMNKALKGDLQIKPSPEEKFVIVEWTKEL